MPLVLGELTANDGYEPMVEFRIVSPDGRSVRVKSSLDSGSPDTIIPGELLEPLGIRFESLPVHKSGRGVGATESTQTRYLHARLYFREWQFGSGCAVWPPGHYRRALVGRSDFFASFTIRFMWHRDPPQVQIDPVV